MSIGSVKDLLGKGSVMRVCVSSGAIACSLLCVFAVAQLSPARGQESEAPAGDQESVETSNYGREAREGTVALWRDPDKPLDARERIHHALSRLTFGVTDEAIYEVERLGIDGWISTQLEAEGEESAALVDRLSKLKSLPLSTQEIVQQYNKRDGNDRDLRNIPRNELKDAVVLLAVYGNNQLKEVLCDFWRNHFSVDVSKGNVRFYATEYERDVFRVEALGTFQRMLNKQARHPAMLVYLDNYISRAPPPTDVLKAAQRAFLETRDYAAMMDAVDIARMKGINENYARELMELHTLGVDNHYTQEDVVAVAYALTGWTVQQNAEKPITFQFRPDMHASGMRLILKKRLPPIPRNPEMEGQLVLNLLVSHEGTAKFIAYKLCRHLVADNPPQELVERVAEVYKKSKSDLPSTYKAIFMDEEFYNPKHYQSKFKRPFEYVISALRVTNAQIESTGGIHKALNLMSEPLYQCEDPTGYYDQADAWRDPGTMAPRWLFARNLGMEQVRGVRIPDSYWEGLKPNNPLQWKEVLTSRILPGGCTEKTSDALDAVIAKYARFSPKPEQLGRFIVGILLGSPEFQRQ